MNLAFTRSGGERNGGLGISRPTQFLVSHSSTTRSEDKPCGRARRGAKGRKGQDGGYQVLRLVGDEDELEVGNYLGLFCGWKCDVDRRMM